MAASSLAIDAWNHLEGDRDRLLSALEASDSQARLEAAEGWTSYEALVSVSDPETPDGEVLSEMLVRARERLFRLWLGTSEDVVDRCVCGICLIRSCGP